VGVETERSAVAGGRAALADASAIPAMRLTGLRKSYGDVMALDHVDLAINATTT
jgi:hypothetical protein